MMLTLVGITAWFLSRLYPAPFLEPDSNKNITTINLLNMGAQLITFSKIRIVVKRKVLSYQNWSNIQPLEMFNKSLKCKHFTKCSLASISKNYHLKLKIKHQKFKQTLQGVKGNIFKNFMPSPPHLRKTLTHVSKGIVQDRLYKGILILSLSLQCKENCFLELRDNSPNFYFLF